MKKIFNQHSFTIHKKTMYFWKYQHKLLNYYHILIKKHEQSESSKLLQIMTKMNNNIISCTSFDVYDSID